MKALFELMPENYFYLRTPIFANKAISDIDRFKSEILSDNVFLEGIRIASPALYQEYCKDFKKGNLQTKVVKALYKYYLRTCYRSTPFGIFSGCILGKITNQTLVKLAPIQDGRPYVQADINFIWDVIELINRELPNGRYWDSIKFYPNDTIYKFAAGFRYVEFTRNYQDFNISSFTDDGVISGVLNACRRGLTLSEVKSFIHSLTDSATEEVQEYILDLVRSNILVSSLRPRVIANDALTSFLSDIKSIDQNIFNELSRLDKIRGEINRRSPGSNIPHYDALDEIAAKLNITANHPYKVDLTLNAEENSISRDLLKNLPAAINILYCSQYQKYKRTREELSKFAQTFTNVYGDQQVSLLQALDPDFGIGYPVNFATNEAIPLLRGLTFSLEGKVMVQDHTLDEWDFYLLDELNKCLRTGRISFELNADKIEHLIQYKDLPLTTSLYTLCNFIQTENGSTHINHIVTSGPSPARNLGRFTNMDDDLTSKLIESIEWEEQSSNGALYAELNYIINQRGINVSNRRDLRRKKINLFPAQDDNSEIPLSDLTVSVRNELIHIHSKRLGKTIIPRLSSSHATQTSLPHYRFLADLQQSDNYDQLYWYWGFLANSPFLPRVMFRNIILSPARWQINYSDFVNKTQGSSEFYQTLRDKLHELNIPNSFVISFADNNLLVDLKNEISLDIFWEYLSKQKTLLVHENTQNGNQFVKSNQGFHNNEVVIPWRMTSEVNHHKETTYTSDVATNFVPGSDWLFYKAYANRSCFDLLLREAIAPTAIALIKDKLISKWFFMKHSDDIGPHLRIRFLLTSQIHFAAAVALISKHLASFLADCTVWKTSIDTYERELNRYLPNNIVNSESLFCADSVAVCEFLALFPENEQARWKMALKGIDALLDDFGYTLEQKFAFAEFYGTSYRREFNFDDKMRGFELDKKYRMFSQQIEQSFQNGDEESKSIASILGQRSEMLKTIISNIKAESPDSKTLSKLISSYIHMFLNRLFRKHARSQEMVCYDFISRYYKSKLARIKKEALKAETSC